MSKAIVKINEDKSSINQNDLTDKELKDAILDIETLFPYLTTNHLEVLLIKSNYSLN